jgi:LuxR family transcriptional regulator, maltose regulon positive regulatory protein
VRRGQTGGQRVLDDKLEVPALGLALSHRARVHKLMDQATAHRVTLVTGPAGAGKTVACATWAATRARQRNGRIGWFTVDAQDREPAHFWRYLVAAFARAGAIRATDADQLVGDLPGSAEDVPQRVLDCLTAGTGRAAVVLDDVHELAGSPVIGGLDEIVHHASADLTLVLAGRHAPGLALAKLRLAGQLADVGPGDLACSPSEADRVLTDLGVPGDLELRSELLAETEGWMAGLRLISMSLPRPGELTDGSIGGERELIADYLRDEVIGRLSAESRHLLQRVSLTETVAPDLAQLLTADSGAAARLDQLCRENCLVYPAGEDGTWYRCHPMLRAELAAELHRDYPDEVPVLLSGIARWHAARGDVLAAIRAAAQGGDWSFGAEVLAAESPVTPAHAPRTAAWAELETLLTSFPPGQRSTDATLACALAAARLWQGDADGALPHLDCAQHALSGGPAPAAAHDAADCGFTATGLWFAALQVMRLAGSDADLTSQQDLAAAADERSASRSQHRALGLLWLALGCAQLRRLDGGQARMALRHAASQLAAGGLAALRERAKSWEAVAHAWYGDPVTATKIAAEVAEGGMTGESADLAPILAVSQALAHVARDEPEAASMLVDQADQAAMAGPPQPAGEPRISVLTGMIRTRIALDEGNAAGARGLVRLLTESAGNEPSADVALAVLDAQTSLAAGELDRAHATLAGLADGRGGPEAAVCQAKLFMAADDDKSALKILEPLICAPPAAVAADSGAPVSVKDRLAGLLTAVIAHRRLNQGPEAAQRLEEALALAEAEDQAGPFIASGTPIRSALTVLITPSSRCAAFAARILDRFDGRLALGADRRFAHASASPSGTVLTESELAVLRFLPSHMTNQEIAEALFLSINTIKTHLSSVYRKLGVTSRRQAIAQGRRLELL